MNHDRQRAARRRAPPAIEGIPAPPSLESLARSVAILNRLLLQHGVAAALPVPVGDGDDAERVSLALMRVLRDLRLVEAVDLLYRLNARRIFSFCRARMKKGEAILDPGDVVAETFLTVLRKCDSFVATPGATFAGWSIVVATNIMRQWGRRERMAPRPPLPEPDSCIDARADAAAAAVSREFAEMVATSWALFLQLCAAGMLSLPSHWRSALELRERDGLTYDDIAARLGVSPSHVGMLIRRARIRVLDLVTGALDRAGRGR
jgi:RNA polymerase sigma factor (sigma-70 family)